jgi:hypothetical protein
VCRRGRGGDAVFWFLVFSIVCNGLHKDQKGENVFYYYYYYFIFFGTRTPLLPMAAKPFFLDVRALSHTFRRHGAGTLR